MVARINNMVSTRGTVASLQLSFERAPESSLYITNEEYALIMHYVAPRVSIKATVLQLRRAVDVLNQLQEVNRLDLVMALVGDEIFNEVGMQVEAEFQIATTGHGETSKATLLVKSFES